MIFVMITVFCSVLFVIALAVLSGMTIAQLRENRKKAIEKRAIETTKKICRDWEKTAQLERDIYGQVVSPSLNYHMLDCPDEFHIHASGSYHSRWKGRR